eukprot:2018093-Prymnesium_polylepis.1
MSSSAGKRKKAEQPTEQPKLKQQAARPVPSQPKPKGKQPAVKEVPPRESAWFDQYVGVDDDYRRYMREEWGHEKRGDQPLFEKLCLEGAQAGLSWATILKKREAYRRAFHGFDIGKCAAMTAADVQRLLDDGRTGAASIVKNRAK